MIISYDPIRSYVFLFLKISKDPDYKILKIRSVQQLTNDSCQIQAEHVRFLAKPRSNFRHSRSGKNLAWTYPIWNQDLTCSDTIVHQIVRFIVVCEDLTKTRPYDPYTIWRQEPYKIQPFLTFSFRQIEPDAYIESNLFDAFRLPTKILTTKPTLLTLSHRNLNFHHPHCHSTSTRWQPKWPPPLPTHPHTAQSASSRSEW